MKVYFIGAGPGDPELITIKGQRILREAQTIIFAGSLVNHSLLHQARPEARIYDSSRLDLEQIISLIRDAVERRETVARIHSGDPSLYGAIQEQMERLDHLGIPYEVVPGVSSFLAAAAAVKKEYTSPGTSQTVIITRVEGRTPGPGLQDLAALARHKASLCLFLSVGMIEDIMPILAAGYPPSTPAAVVFKATWPEQEIVTGTIADLAAKLANQGIKRSALILVGDFLAGNASQHSLLYSPDFSHSFRGL